MNIRLDVSTVKSMNLMNTSDILHITCSHLTYFYHKITDWGSFKVNMFDNVSPAVRTGKTELFEVVQYSTVYSSNFLRYLASFL